MLTLITIGDESEQSTGSGAFSSASGLATTALLLTAALFLTAALLLTTALLSVAPLLPLLFLLLLAFLSALLLTLLTLFLKPLLTLFAHLSLTLGAALIGLTPPGFDTGQDIGMISQGSTDPLPAFMTHLGTGLLVLLMHGLQTFAQLGPLSGTPAVLGNGSADSQQDQGNKGESLHDRLL